MRTLAFLTALLVIVGTAAADDDKVMKALKQDVDVATGQFEKDIAKARAAARKRFDAQIQTVKQSRGMSASGRASAIEELKSQGDAFEKNGSWPDSTALISDALTYARQLNKNYPPVARAFEKAIDTCLKADRQEGVQTFTRAKAEFDEKIRGNRLRAGSKWAGSRHGEKGSTLFKLLIDKVNDAVIDGTAHDGSSIFAIRGEIHGNHIRCATTQVRRGKAQALNFDGFIIQDKILMVVGGVTGDGKVVHQNLVWLKAE